MKRIDVRKRVLGLAIVLGTATSGHFLTACSTNSPTQAQAPNSNTTQVSSQPMDHSHQAGMNHSEMDLGPADAEFDLRLIDAMIPHHEGAIAMANDVLKKSKRPELKKLAADIIAAQTKEINQMRQWRKAWYPKAPQSPVAWHAPMGHSMAMSEDQIKSMRMEMDLGSADTAFDQRFIDAMIPHHEGAVVMANDVLKKSKRPAVLQLAKSIIASQQAEINQMKQWRKAWYGQ